MVFERQSEVLLGPAIISRAAHASSKQEFLHNLITRCENGKKKGRHDRNFVSAGRRYLLFKERPHRPLPGEGYGGINLEALSRIKASYEVRNRELGKDPSPDKITAATKKSYDVNLKDDEVKAIAEHRVRKLGPGHFPDMDEAIAFALRPSHRVGWATETHSASPLMLWGIGPGSEKINGWKHNTELFRIMQEAFGF